MEKQVHKVGLGGGCHWCTEAVFQSLKGVRKVEQGYIASTGQETSYSEGVIVHFNPDTISLQILIQIHLHTHNSSSDHSMRDRYRSAVYVFSEAQAAEAQRILDMLCDDFDQPPITQVLPYKGFRASREAIRNYYYSDPERPFCKSFIDPKIQILIQKFSDQICRQKLPEASIVEKN